MSPWDFCKAPSPWWFSHNAVHKTRANATLLYPRILLAYLQFLLYQELFISRELICLTESNVTLCWLSLRGVACVNSWENKHAFLLQQTLGTDWSQRGSNSSHSLFHTTRPAFTLQTSRQESDTGLTCPLTAALIAHSRIP